MQSFSSFVLQALEQHIKSVTLEVQEQREMRTELERHVIKWKEEGADWKKRYENEARLRIEDVDMLKKKFGAQIADLQVREGCCFYRLFTLKSTTFPSSRTNLTS